MFVVFVDALPDGGTQLRYYKRLIEKIIFGRQVLNLAHVKKKL